MNITNDKQNTTTASQKTASGKQPWYTKTGWIITLLILFFPVGLYLMWKHCKWGKKTKGIVTAVVLIFALLCSSDSEEPNPSGNRNLSVSSQSSQEESSSTADFVAIEEIESTEETSPEELSTAEETTTEEETSLPESSTEEESSLPESSEPESTVEEIVAEALVPDTEFTEHSSQDIPDRNLVITPQEEATISAQTEATPAPETQPTIAPTQTVAPSTAAPIAAGTQYVANTNTGKFHYPSCSSVDQMKNKNRWDYTGMREDLISMGYVPCKRCNP